MLIAVYIGVAFQPLHVFTLHAFCSFLLMVESIGSIIALHFLKDSVFGGFFLLSFFGKLLCILRTYYNNTVFVSNENITGKYYLTAASDWDSNFTGAEFPRPLRSYSFGIYWHFKRFNSVKIAKTTIDYDTGTTEII